MRRGTSAESREGLEPRRAAAARDGSEARQQRHSDSEAARR